MAGLLMNKAIVAAFETQLSGTCMRHIRQSCMGITSTESCAQQQQQGRYNGPPQETI